MTLEIIKNILDTQMSMPVNRVWAYNADVDLPKDGNLFIVLRMAYRTPFSNNTRMKPTETGFEEHQTMNVAEDIIISLLSKTTEARDRAYEVQMALGSTYSIQQQELNKLHISRIGEVYDASFLEATSRLNRFDVRCRVLRSYDIINNIDYYDTFSGSLWVNQGSTVTKTDFSLNQEEL